MFPPSILSIAATAVLLCGQLTFASSPNDHGNSARLPGASSFVASAGYPTSAFSSYYPVPSGQEPQPKLFDPVLNKTWPLNLTDPETIPEFDPDQQYYPDPVANLSQTAQQEVISSIINQVGKVITSSSFSSNCSKCLAALSVGKSAALLGPKLVPEAMVELCIKYKLHSNATCEEDFRADTFGYTWTEILAFADVSGLDGQYICNSLSSTFCPYPVISPLNTTGLFPKPKPTNPKVHKPSGKRVKVLHLSDLHLDPRYDVGAEGNCTSNLCCRANNPNTALPVGHISIPAPAFGAFQCDAPYDLALAAMQAIGPLTGTSKKNPLAWTIYTGDLVSHDPQSQLSRAYVEYAEDSIFQMFKEYLTGPVFPVLDPEAINAPHSLPGDLGYQMSWNYEHVAALWKLDGWIDDAAEAEARIHYGGYSIKAPNGPRIITWNSDFWYKSNFLNFINTSNPDVSGSFAWVISELQKAEDAGERVWLMAHVLSGWDGSNPLQNPSNLFYQIVDRYAPHVIANVFFGHTHEDQVMIYYANNGTVQDAAHALTPGWIGPSVTPLTNLNSGFRLYEVDTGTFDIYEAYTYYTDVSKFKSLNATGHGPTFEFEYSTRDAYGDAACWPEDEPLNGAFWHEVTEAMQRDRTLVSTFNTYQGKSSVQSPNCTSQACAEAKVCYIRSGSVPLGRKCPQGFGSVQSKYTGKNF